MVKKISSEYLYKGSILNLRIDSIKSESCLNSVREIVEHKPAVAVFAVNEKNKICLVSQYRDAVNMNMIEIPAGLIEPNESPYEAATRELFEETGIKSVKLIKIMSFYTSPGFSTEVIHLFYTSSFEMSSIKEIEDNEISFLRWYTIKEVSDEIKKGNITDSKTLLAYYWYIGEKIQYDKLI